MDQTIEEKRKLFSDSILSDVLEHLSGNITITDGEANVLYINQNTANTHSYPREVFMTMTMHEIIQKGIIKNSSTLAAIKQRTTVKKFIQKADGTGMYTVSTPVFDNLGRIRLVVTYAQDEDQMYELLNDVSDERNSYQQALAYINATQDQSTPIIAESAAMKSIFNFASRVARTDGTVILYGESGTGKDVLAKYIHKKSKRSERVFIPVNCASVPESLIESEFFGYEKGAFTGANLEGKPGLFEVADKGTLFLDEIGELPLPVQAKLLRVLEEKEFKRLGGTATKRTDARIIAATNRNLRQMMNEGSFREDLYYRLNVISITIPPLRDRREDIPPLAQSFVCEYNKKYGFYKTLSGPALEQLRVYPWPGNIRELRNTIESMIITTVDNVIDFATFPLSMSLRPAVTATPKGDRPPLWDYEKTWKENIHQFEKSVVERTLERTGGNVDAAAQLLGLHRSSLYSKLKDYGIRLK